MKCNPLIGKKAFQDWKKEECINRLNDLLAFYNEQKQVYPSSFPGLNEAQRESFRKQIGGSFDPSQNIFSDVDVPCFQNAYDEILQCMSKLGMKEAEKKKFGRKRIRPGAAKPILNPLAQRSSVLEKPGREKEYDAFLEKKVLPKIKEKIEGKGKQEPWENRPEWKNVDPKWWTYFADLLSNPQERKKLVDIWLDEFPLEMDDFLVEWGPNLETLYELSQPAREGRTPKLARFEKGKIKEKEETKPRYEPQELKKKSKSLMQKAIKELERAEQKERLQRLEKGEGYESPPPVSKGLRSLRDIERQEELNFLTRLEGTAHEEKILERQKKKYLDWQNRLYRLEEEQKKKIRQLELLAETKKFLPPKSIERTQVATEIKREKDVLGGIQKDRKEVEKQLDRLRPLAEAESLASYIRKSGEESRQEKELLRQEREANFKRQLERFQKK